MGKNYTQKFAGNKTAGIKRKPISYNQAHFDCPECGTTFNTSETGHFCPECGQNVKNLGDVNSWYKEFNSPRT